MSRPWSARCYGVARQREGSRQNSIGIALARKLRRKSPTGGRRSLRAISEGLFGESGFHKPNSDCGRAYVRRTYVTHRPNPSHVGFGGVKRK